MESLFKELQNCLTKSEELIPKLNGVLRRFKAVSTLLLMRRDTSLQELDQYIHGLRMWLDSFANKSRSDILQLYAEKTGIVTEYQKEVQKEMDTLKTLADESTHILLKHNDEGAEEKTKTILQAFSVMLHNSTVDLEMDETIPSLQFVRQFKNIEDLPSLGSVQPEYKIDDHDEQKLQKEIQTPNSNVQENKNNTSETNTLAKVNTASPKKTSLKGQNSPSLPCRYLQKQLGRSGLLGKDSSKQFPARCFQNDRQNSAISSVTSKSTSHVNFSVQNAVNNISVTSVINVPATSSSCPAVLSKVCPHSPVFPNPIYNASEGFNDSKELPPQETSNLTTEDWERECN